MSFVKARKGDKIIKVSKAAFDSQFKNAGWRLAGGVKQQTVDDWDSVDDPEDDLLEKPVGDMTPDEVKKAAAIKGINTQGKSIKQLRDEIKRSL